jgi:hypothetical protein
MSTTNGKGNAAAEFRRMVKWIAVVAAMMVIGALVYLDAMGDLSLHVVIATVLGVFLSVLLGSGLFALAFFSDKSGHDDTVKNATRSQRENKD